MLSPGSFNAQPKESGAFVYRSSTRDCRRSPPKRSGHCLDLDKACTKFQILKCASTLGDSRSWKNPTRSKQSLVLEIATRS